MNNYIALNKAVNPVCIYDGYEPLIIKKNGVDAMSIKFDGTPSEYATCAGAPEMFIKVEQEGLYYFGVEADDTGSITIVGDFIPVCEKQGDRPHGKLALATGARYMKIGYYKVALSYGNNAYDPVSNNAIAFNATMDSQPIQKGDYSKDSTMKRSFSMSPKLKLWTIEREADITCEPSKEVKLDCEKPEPAYVEEFGDCSTGSMSPKICVTVCKDEVANVWRGRVASASSGSDIIMYKGGYTNPLITSPQDEQEATDAVNIMNGYQARGQVGIWHTPAASLAHEEHHRRQWHDAFKFYWKDLKIQEAIEKVTLSMDKYKDINEAISALQLISKDLAYNFWVQVAKYVLKLPDDANTRPYCAGQEALNEATAEVIRLADAMEWTKVPRVMTPPGIIEPPCFLPPVSEKASRSWTSAEVPEHLNLSIVDISRFMEGKITICFHNKGSYSIRIPDEINDNTSHCFFLTVLRTELGNTRVLNVKTGKITFQHPLNYLNLAPGEEYRVTIPICLDELEAWKQCACELETNYYNQQGKDCFRGTLRATSQIVL